MKNGILAYLILFALALSSSTSQAKNYAISEGPYVRDIAKLPEHALRDSVRAAPIESNINAAFPRPTVRNSEDTIVIAPQISVALFSDVFFTFNHRRTVEEFGRKLWVGDTHDELGRPVVAHLSFDPESNQVDGLIRTATEHYQITSDIDDVPWVIERPTSASDVTSGETDLIEPEGRRPDAPKTGESHHRSTGGDPIIDVMVVYTPAFQALRPNSANSAGLTSLTLEVMEDIYEDSGVDLQFNLVYLGPITYTEVYEPNLLNDVTRLRNKTDGYMDQVHAIRDSVNADVVMLFNAQPHPNPTAVGRVFGIPGSLTVANEDLAFTVVSYPDDRDTAVAHELGHILAARHDWLDDGTNGQPFAFNHAKISEVSRTFMAIQSSCGVWDEPFYTPPCFYTVIEKFSNPQQGTGTAGYIDNAQAIRLAAPIVEQYRNSGANPPPTPASLHIDNECAGFATATWPASSGATSYQLYKATNSAFTNQTLIYSGTSRIVGFHVNQTSWLRVRACTGSSCSTYRNGNTTAKTNECNIWQ